MRGRKPIPTEMKRLADNPGKRKLPAPDVSSPSEESAPVHLDGDALAKWAELAPALIRRGVLSATDRDALEADCTAYAQWREARGQMVGENLTVETPNGAIQQHPLVSVIKQAQDSMRAWAGELGLTPSSRTRVGGDGRSKGGQGEQDPLFNPRRMEPPKRVRKESQAPASAAAKAPPGSFAAPSPIGPLH